MRLMLQVAFLLLGVAIVANYVYFLLNSKALPEPPIETAFHGVEGESLLDDSRDS